MKIEIEADTEMTYECLCQFSRIEIKWGECKEYEQLRKILKKYDRRLVENRERIKNSKECSSVDSIVMMEPRNKCNECSEKMNWRNE